MTSPTDARGSTPSAPRHKNTARPVFVVVSVLAVLALAASVWFGIGWKSAADDASIADTRDSALNGAQQAVINLTTVDSSNLSESLDTMLTSVTGDEMTQFIEGVRTSFTEDQRDLSAKTSSELVTGTLTELSIDNGEATAVVVVNTTTTRDNAAPAKQRTVMELQMVDVDGVWKARQVTPVGNPVPLNIDDPNAADPAAPADPNATADPTAPADPGAPAGQDASPAPVPDPAEGP